VTAFVFGIVAVILVWPAPSWLASAQWPLRAPRAAMALWQSIALAAVLSAFSCGLAIASNVLTLNEQGRPIANPLEEVATLGIVRWTAYITVFLLTLFVGARLIYSVIRVAMRTRARRSAHRQLVDLLDRMDRSVPDSPLSARDVRMLEVDQPMAYCLPGLRQRVVLSEGTVARLTRDELEAVISHERAHLRARHDLILEAFIAVHDAFPRFVRSRSALGAVQLLVELLADDTAIRTTGRTQLGRALVACADSVAPSGAMAIGGPSTLARVKRLSDTRPTMLISTLAYTAAAAILVIPTLAVAIPWLNELHRLISS
jgi:Zn-dependent protease with chaperone function